MTEKIPAWVDGELAPVGKLDVHQRGLRHKAVSVFVMRGTDVLIQQRALSKYHTPGLWANTCCTHPRWGEDAGVCAVRRLDEELGITGLAPVWKGRVEYRADVGGGLIEHEVVEIFTAQVSGSLGLDPDPSEVMATKWVDIYELAARVTRHPAEFTPWLQIYLDQHLDLIFGDLARV
ncbi:isopentenyl-diphosphate Delta-isomerase [Rhodobacterales bacterium HKCCE4037]|nr:isopentenyl-diphosphate Delta-isomerase [Rhodobacterales bacterium HKCCE4037]